MNRRIAVRNLLIGSGGLITLPFWMQSCGISNSNIHPSSFSPDEQNILSSIADTIIPPGNNSSVGAISLGVDKFLQKLIDDCYEKPVQDNVKNQLHSLDASAKSNYRKSFADCSQRQRQDMLLKFSSSQIKEENEFFDLMKSETIRGFNTSHKVMVDYLNYKIAPGHYYGCVNVKA
jgi:hypothetical protein